MVICRCPLGLIIEHIALSFAVSYEENCRTGWSWLPLLSSVPVAGVVFRLFFGRFFSVGRLKRERELLAIFLPISLFVLFQLEQRVGMPFSTLLTTILLLLLFCFILYLVGWLASCSSTMSPCGGGFARARALTPQAQTLCQRYAHDDDDGGGGDRVHPTASSAAEMRWSFLPVISF